MATVNIPSVRTQNNISKFSAMWANGDIVACKESCAAAHRYLNAFGDWLYQNMEQQHDQLVGLVEYANFKDRANLSIKKWKI